jgi:hypothetical protein
MLSRVSSLLDQEEEPDDEAAVTKQLLQMKQDDDSEMARATSWQHLAHMGLLPLVTAANMFYGTDSHERIARNYYLSTLVVMCVGWGVLCWYLVNNRGSQFHKEYFTRGFLASQGLNAAMLLATSIAELVASSHDINVASGVVLSLRSFLLFNFATSSAVLKHDNIPESTGIAVAVFPMVVFLVVAACMGTNAASARAQLVASDLALFSMAGIPMLFWTR